MDCHKNPRYHPYAPPADARHERYLGREWNRQDQNPPFPLDGHRGGRNSRYSNGRRGTGNMSRSMDREDIYHSHPAHRPVRSPERHFHSRYDGPQRRPSSPWYQGRSMHNGPPRPPINYYMYYERNTRVHYREAGYGPPPRLHPKSMRSASTPPTGSSFPNSKSLSSTTPTGSPHFSKSSTTKMSDSACSPQRTNTSLVYRHMHPNSTGSSGLPSVDKQTTSDVKNPSIVKVAPFSHQPSPNCTKSSVSTSSSSLSPNSSTVETNSQVKTENPMVLNLSSKITETIGSEESTGGQTCLAPDGGLMTVFAPTEDGQMRPICTTICSCQLRKRALKYIDKGKTKDDSIVIDSDEEDDKKNDMGVESINKKGVEKLSESCSPVKDKSSEVLESSCQDSPRKRAKMSTENSAVNSLPTEGQSEAIVGTEAIVATEASSPLTESLADTISRVVDGLRQSLGEGCSSSTSSDSLSSVVTANYSDEAALLGNPQILREILSICKETSKPSKKLKTSPRNLYTAAKDCNIQKVLALLVEGCDPNQQLLKVKGKTAMHAAAAGGYVDIMACLRLAGCDLNLVDYDNRTPLFDAVSNHKVKAVEYLIDCGATLGVKDTNGMSCLHLATRQGHTDLIKLLLKTGRFNINEKDDGGWTPIMWAAEDKQYDATQLLIEQGANVHIRDEELNIPLHWAAYSGNLEVCKLLLTEQTDINSQNEHMDTPLHIAVRKDHYECVQLFLGRGADVHVRNKDGLTPVQVVKNESKGKSLVQLKLDLESCQESIRPRILHSDISRGQENVSISCINEVDDEPFPEFTFVKESCEIYNGTINWSISKFEGCDCQNDCTSGGNCSCAESSERQRIWYKDGLLKGDMQRFDRPLLFECNKMCTCWSYCRNRVVQRGMQYPLQLYRTYKKGWGVRSLAEIQQGSFVCEYTGELISDTEADARNDDSYLFDLDCKESAHELYCIDAKNYGNISRFINHSCEPNVFPIRVFIHHRDIRFPRIAFFATKEIKVHDEICFNYGDRFWSVKKKEFYCECGTPSCKYRDPRS